MWSTGDECDRTGRDVIHRDAALISDQDVVYEDEFIYDASLDEIDSVHSSTDEDEDFMLFAPVRLNFASPFFHFFSGKRKP